MSDTLPIERKVEVAREFVARVFNEHQPDRACDYFTDDVVWHGGSLGKIAGVDNVVNLLRAFIGALPDLNAAEQDLIASGDLVAMRLVVTATHSADLLGIPNTGRRVQWDAVDIYRVNDDGKISEEWALDDMASFASQLGAISLPWAG
ncbi:MAG TPA: ester cyclase [Acidimicrobiales bacterium]